MVTWTAFAILAMFLFRIINNLDLVSLLNAFRKKEGVSRETALKTFKNNLEAALPLLKAAKVVGLIEPINPYSVPNYNMDNYEDAVQLVKDLDSPWLRLQLDIFHLQQIKGNITRNIKDFHPIVGHVRVCDKKCLSH